MTADYLTAARAWLGARLRHRDELQPVDPATYDGRVADGRAEVAAIADGLLRRSLFTARRAAARPGTGVPWWYRGHNVSNRRGHTVQDLWLWP